MWAAGGGRRVSSGRVGAGDCVAAGGGDVDDAVSFEAIPIVVVCASSAFDERRETRGGMEEGRGGGRGVGREGGRRPGGRGTNKTRKQGQSGRQAGRQH